MNEDRNLPKVFETIIDGGPVHIGLHVLTCGIAIYVIFRALTAYFRRTHLPATRFVFLSFVPLVTASVGVYVCLIFMHAVVFSTDTLWSPWALPAGIDSAKLFLHSGWICSALSLLSVYAASRTTVA